METETINKLLEKLEKQQYIDVIRYLSQHNKRIKIPGFSHMEKAPTKLVANTARTNRIFRKALFESISGVILSGADINLDRDVEDIKSDIPKNQWLGLAAFLLLLENDVYAFEAEKIIDEYGDNHQEDVVQEIVNLPKSDKKEEKFREKYLKARIEIAELTAELEKHVTLLREKTAENEQLREGKKELEQRCITYLAQLDALNKEKTRLLGELEATQAKMIAAQSIPQPKLDIQVLAPCCEDILGRYTMTIPIDFENAPQMTSTEAMSKYDEIWVFPDVVPFGTYRTLRKWKKAYDENVNIFQTATDLVDYAEKLIQNR